MPDRVVDASVLGAVFFREPRMAEARELVAGARLYEPLLLRYELTRIARKKLAVDADNLVRILDALGNALVMDIQWVPVDHIKVVNLSIQTGLTTYDSSYLYVAQVTDAPFVTFDKEMQKALRDT